MMIDVDGEETLESQDARSGQIAALHDDCGVEGSVDRVCDLDLRNVRERHERRWGLVLVDDAHLLAERLERTGHGKLRANRIAVRSCVRGDDESVAGPDGLDNACERVRLSRLRHRHS